MIHVGNYVIKINNNSCHFLLQNITFFFKSLWYSIVAIILPDRMVTNEFLNFFLITKWKYSRIRSRQVINMKPFSFQIASSIIGERKWSCSRASFNTLRLKTRCIPLSFLLRRKTDISISVYTLTKDINIDKFVDFQFSNYYICLRCSVSGKREWFNVFFSFSST